MGIKELRESGLIEVKTHEFDYTDENGVVTKYKAIDVPFMVLQSNALKAAGGKDHFALLVSSSITDESGQHLTYDEVLKLEPKIAEAFLVAAIKANKSDDDDGAEGKN